MVVSVGETDLDPESTGVTAPMPGEISTLTAFADVQVRVDEPPADIEVGLAVSVTVG